MNPQYNSNFNDLMSLLNNHNQNQLSDYPSASTQSKNQNINIIKTKKYILKDNENIKMNINSLLNIPYSKKYSNSTLKMNDNDEENDPIFKEYSEINNNRNETIDELKNINKKISARCGVKKFFNFFCRTSRHRHQQRLQKFFYYYRTDF